MLLTRNEARATRLLYLEIVLSSVPGGIIAFNGAYLLRLGGSNLEVSLLGALPALAAVFVSVPAGHFLQTRCHPHRWTMACLGIYWTGFFLMGLAPLIPLRGVAASALAVTLLGLASLPTQIFNVGIYPLLADLVPENRRVHVFAVRGIVSSCVISVVTFVTGQWLNAAPFPGNYQSTYTVGWICGLIGVSILALANGIPRPRPAQPLTAPAPVAPLSWRFWPADLAHQHDFVRFTFNTILHSLALWLSAPLLVVYYVRSLGANDAWLGLLATVTSLSTIVGLFVWRGVAERWRVPRTLRWTVLSVGLLPLLVGLIPNLTVILVLAAFNGFMTAGITISHINVMLMTFPEDRRPQFMGLYSATINAGAFVAPLLAVALADRLGLGPTLVACGVIGLVGACAHWIWQVPGRPPSSVVVVAQAEAEGA